MTTHQDLPRFELGFPGPLRDRLVAAVLSGAKTATTGLLTEYARFDEPLPVVGQQAVLPDSAGRGHEEYWHGPDMREALGDPEFTVDDDTMVVTETFRVAQRLAAPDAG
ncbi:RNA-binding protein [Streptomyces sp. NPDC101393]|uniref:RNA-binding protein n=1 Tax=Streptomyces sp. NPDC101393 TaxID=3366141 RepID=UPI0038120B47